MDKEPLQNLPPKSPGTTGGIQAHNTKTFNVPLKYADYYYPEALMRYKKRQK